MIESEPNGNLKPDTLRPKFLQQAMHPKAPKNLKLSTETPNFKALDPDPHIRKYIDNSAHPRPHLHPDGPQKTTRF